MTAIAYILHRAENLEAENLEAEYTSYSRDFYSNLFDEF